jgi:chromosome partitioning protein
MGKIIGIVNQKGGVGKTTTVVNLSTYLANSNKKVLVIDMDPQANTTSGFGFEKEQISESIYDVLINNISIKDVIYPTDIENLNLVPATIDLAGAEIELVSALSREVKLKNSLKKIKESYDYIIIDAQPSLGLLTVNILSAVDSILIPLQCEFYALEGLAQLLNTIQLIKESLNENLEIEGVLLTMFDSRTNLSVQIMNDTKQFFKDKIVVYETIIPRNVKLSECSSFGKPILYYDNSSKGAKAYEEFTKEFLKYANKK